MGLFIKNPCIIAVFSLSVLMFIIGGAGPAIINAILRSRVKDRVKLNEDNKDRWTQVPGELGIEVLRKFTFFNFENYLDVIFDGAKPEFNEVGPYTFQEYRNYTEREYVQNDEVVKFNYWQRILPASQYGTTGEEMVNVMKMGPLGAWNSLKENPPYSLALSVLSSLFYSLNDNLQISIMSGRYYSILDGSGDGSGALALNGQLQGLGISSDLATKVINDSKYGIYNPVGLKTWVEMLAIQLDESDNIEMKSYTGNGNYQILRNYFGISHDDLHTINLVLFNGFLIGGVTPFPGFSYMYTDVLMGQICAGLLGGNPVTPQTCPPQLLSAAQWTQQLPTNQASVADTNSTSFGYPELSAYYNNVFVNLPDGGQILGANHLAGEFFSPSWAMDVMAYKTDGDFTVEQNALLNVGNLGFLFGAGDEHDKLQLPIEQAPGSPYMQAISARLGLRTQDMELTNTLPERQALVFWNYLKYIVSEIALSKTELEGTEEVSAIGNFAASGTIGGFQGLQDNLLPGLIGSGVAGALAANSVTCNALLTGHFLDAQITGLCTSLGVNNAPLSMEAVIALRFLCTRENYGSYEQLKAAIQATDDQINSFCAADQTFMGTVNTVAGQLAVAYSCEDGYCSNFEIAAKQWFSGDVTRNPPSQAYPAADSVNAWFPDSFTKPIEFYAVSKMRDPSFTGIAGVNYENLKNMLSFNSMFSKTLISKAFLWNNSDANKPLITQNFGIPEADIHRLLGFYRYTTIEVSFGGFVQQITTSQALQGSNDSFLTALKNTNPQQGGNPGINNFVRLNEANMAYEDRLKNKQSMYTGEGNIDDIRKYKSIYELDYIGKKEDAFNGFTVEEQEFNVWEKKLEFLGTDGVQSKPLQEEGDTIGVHITSSYFGAILQQFGEVDHEGMDCYRYVFDDQILASEAKNPKNAHQFFDGPNGLLNLTEARNSPIFLSLPHFYLGDQALNDAVTIYNKDGNVQGPSEADETYVHSEKWTGATLSVALRLQINYRMQPDILFPVENDIYLPVYYMDRGANWTESQVDDRFGALRNTITAYWVVLIVGLSLGFSLLVTGVIQIVMRKKASDMDGRKVKNVGDQEYKSQNVVSSEDLAPNTGNQLQD